MIPGLLDGRPRRSSRGPLFYSSLAADGSCRCASTRRFARHNWTPPLAWACEWSGCGGERRGRSRSDKARGALPNGLAEAVRRRLAGFAQRGAAGAVRRRRGQPADRRTNAAWSLRTREELTELLTRAAAAGISGQVHAIGDAAVRAVLDVFASTRRTNGPLHAASRARAAGRSRQTRPALARWAWLPPSSRSTCAATLSPRGSRGGSVPRTLSRCAR